MDKIKFRVWDVVRKQLAYQFVKKVVAEDGTEFSMLAFAFVGGADWSPEVVTLARALAHPDRYVVEQFVGLPDKNGTEIYEGDIVKQTTASGTDPHVRPVIFIQGTFGAGRPFDFHNLVTGIVEFMGNIHENLELLT